MKNNGPSRVVGCQEINIIISTHRVTITPSLLSKSSSMLFNVQLDINNCYRINKIIGCISQRNFNDYFIRFVTLIFGFSDFQKSCIGTDTTGDTKYCSRRGLLGYIGRFVQDATQIYPPAQNSPLFPNYPLRELPAFCVCTQVRVVFYAPNCINAPQKVNLKNLSSCILFFLPLHEWDLTENYYKRLHHHTELN